MPEVPIKEVRLPELRLPEISREEIMRTMSEVHRPDISDLVAHLPGRAPKAEVASGRRVLARIAALLAVLPAIDLSQVADAASRLVRRVRPAPKRSFLARMGLGAPRIGRPRLRVVIAALIVAAVASILISAGRAARRRAMSAAPIEPDGLEIVPDGIAVVEVVEVEAIAEATRISSPAGEATRWEDDGGHDAGDGDGMPIFDESPTTA